MTTPADALAVFRDLLGVHEVPDGSNNAPPVTDWYGMRGSWCAMTVSYVLHHAGLPIGPGPKGFAWCSAGADYFRGQGRCHPSRDARPGDIAFMEWGLTAGGYDHVGMVLENTGADLLTIEGNIGNAVRVQRRRYSEVPEVARPPYTEPAPAPPPAPPKELPVSLASLTLPAAHPTLPGAGLEARAAGYGFALRWQDPTAPGGWTAWALPGLPRTPLEVDSITLRADLEGRLVALVWHSTNPGLVWRAWQNTPGGAWDGWLEV